MRTYAGLTVSSVLLLAVLGGCGGTASPSDAGDTGNGGQSSETTTATTTVTSTSSANTTATGMTGDGDDSCADGRLFDFGVALDGELDPTGDVDYFKLQGHKGQVLMFDIDAQYPDTSYNPNDIDTVLTLFDAGGKQVAQNDDPIMFSTVDSRLYTILPEDGEYCLRVAECWSVLKNPGSSCASPKDKSFVTYTLYPYEVDASFTGYVADEELGDDTSTATVAETRLLSGYYWADLWGYFDDLTDIDVFAVTLPAETPVVDGRAVGYFYIVPNGDNESGSTATVGDFFLVDPAEPNLRWASIQGTENSSLASPLEVGKEYWLVVNRAVGSAGSNDFYYVLHFGADGNPLEAEVDAAGTNDTLQTAEPLYPDVDRDGEMAAYLEGDLANAPSDVDYFQVVVPPGKITIEADCAAQIQGSGLSGLKVTILRSDGDLIGADVETEDHYLVAQGSVIAGETIFVKVEASSQSTEVTSSFYRCGIHFT